MASQWNPQGGSSLHCFQIELEFGNVGFWGGRKTGEKPSEQGQEPTKDSIYIWLQVWESNPDHIGGRQMLNQCAIPAPQFY